MLCVVVFGICFCGYEAKNRHCKVAQARRTASLRPRNLSKAKHAGFPAQTRRPRAASKGARKEKMRARVFYIEKSNRNGR
jgi:hypothetical protein